MPENFAHNFWVFLFVVYDSPFNGSYNILLTDKLPFINPCNNNGRSGYGGAISLITIHFSCQGKTQGAMFQEQNTRKV